MPPSPGRFGLFLLRLPSYGGLVALALVAVSLATTSHRVDVTVDGQEVSLRTWASTVGDALERLDVELTGSDLLSHDLEAPLVDGMDIAVTRAATVDVHVDGEFATTVTAPVASVAGVLAEAGLDDVRDQDAVIAPGWTAPVADGDVVHVWLPSSVVVSVDDRRLEVDSYVSTVGALLTEQGVRLGPHDILSVHPATPLREIDHVRVRRVTFVEESTEVVVDYDEDERESDGLLRGTSRVEQHGADGLAERVYRVTLIDGEEVAREPVDEIVVEEPTSRVVVVGTAEPSMQVSSDGPGGAPAADDPVWDRLAQCESNGNWSNISANGMYYGGLQFLPSTWRSVGGSGMPHEASREEQIYRAQLLQARSGWGQWPACSSRLGLR